MPQNIKVNPVESLVAHFAATLPDSLAQREELLKTFIERFHFKGAQEKEQAVKLQQILFHIRQHSALIARMQVELPLNS